MSVVRVVIVDDHPVVRAGLHALLQASGKVDVVGEAGSGAEARSVVPAAAPDVVLMDLRLGEGIDGVETTAALLAAPRPPRVLVLTTYDTDADIIRAVEAGAIGYLLKDAPAASLVAAVQQAARGETVLAPRAADVLLTRLRQPRTALTERELDVLRRVAEGLSNRAIARDMFISEATVKTHLVHCFEKLGADSRTGAVAAARRQGLLT